MHWEFMQQSFQLFAVAAAEIYEYLMKKVDQ